MGRAVCVSPSEPVARTHLCLATVYPVAGRGPRVLKIGIIAVLLAAIAVPAALYATQGQSGTEARINAYKHEDGRIEFGMQLRDGDDWGERLLPRGRYLSADAPIGRWLNSTSVSLADAFDRYNPITQSGILNDISYSTEMLCYARAQDFAAVPGCPLQTTIVVPASSATNRAGRPTTATFEITCRSGALYSYMGEGVAASPISATFKSPHFSALVRFEFPAPRTLREQYGTETYATLDNLGDSIEQHYDYYTQNGYAEVRYRYATHNFETGDPIVRFAFEGSDGVLWPQFWLSSLLLDQQFLLDRVISPSHDRERLVVSVPGYVGEDRASVEVFEATFDVGDLTDVPVVLNIWNCGSY